MARRINVKEKRLAEERAKHEKLYKEQEGAKVEKLVVHAAKTEADKPPRQSPLSKMQATNNRPHGECRMSFAQGQRPPAPAAIKPDSLPVYEWRAIAPDNKQPVYIRQTSTRFPRDPQYFRAAAQPPQMESISGDPGPRHFLHRGPDMHRRAVYGGESIYRQDELIFGRDSSIMSHPPDYFTDPQDHRDEGHANFPFQLDPRPHLLTSLQGHYELDRDFLQEERPYYPQRLLPLSRPSYPAAMEMPRATELAYVRASGAHDPRFDKQQIAGRIPAATALSRSEATAMHATKTVGATRSPVFPTERRHVDDAKLLLLLNGKSH
eukprot:CAMPEP_0113568796 /NCGR_PEP_ID=MMETSP0015_2-20120614/24050_1 /TAXON_ID=2838 /ORGANISM="Odontella" /LENGTH=321 /DNA_ID=CAMNT_0000471381 /DNA_START=268 /DNA_END=1233 /DNA_ORIENTATION=+ /assembly_acc=CAM_ASM_000160